MGLPKSINWTESLKEPGHIFVPEYAHQWSQSRMKQKAQFIVAGEVKNSEENTDGQLEFTDQTLELTNVYKGGLKQKNITIHQVGSKDMSSPETTILHSGQKVILYLVKGENGKYNLINDGASIFIKNVNHGSAFYTRGNDSVQIAFSKIVN